MAAVSAERLGAVQLPLALHPVGSVPLAVGISLSEDHDGQGAVFVWGGVGRGCGTPRTPVLAGSPRPSS